MKIKVQSGTAADIQRNLGITDEEMNKARALINRLQVPVEATECPFCKEITLEAQEIRTDKGGHDYTVYECGNCHRELNY